MGDKRRAADVPDTFRREFIDRFHAEWGDWPTALSVYAAWEALGRPERFNEPHDSERSN